MNRTYKVIWCEATQNWVVTSELAAGKKKLKTSRSAKMWQAACLLGGAVTSFSGSAADIDLSTTDPATQTWVFTGNDNLIQGSGSGFKALARGDTGYTSMTLAQARDAGLLTSGSEYVDSENLSMGSRTQIITYTDPVTHTKQTLNAYDNNTMSAKTLDGVTYAFSHDVGPTGQYLDKSIYSVATGANLTVNVGETDSNWAANAANKVNVILKGSSPDGVTASVFSVDQGGTLNYDSKTQVALGNYRNVNSSTSGAITSIATYAGEVDSKIGHFSIYSLADFQNYNTALITAVEKGELSSAEYVTELVKGHTPTIYFKYADSTTAGDPVNANVGPTHIAYLKAKGADAQINLNPDSIIQLVATDASLVSLEQGAVLNNSGSLASLKNSQFGSYVVNATTGSTVHNVSAGVINVNADADATMNTGLATGVYATDSTFINDGVINVATLASHTGNVGVRLYGSSNVENNGNINLATTAQTAGVSGIYEVGAQIMGSSTMTNKGLIAIGRSGQTSLTDDTTDVDVVVPGATAVYVGETGKFINAAQGNITLGSKTQGAIAIQVQGSDAQVDQQGTITLENNGLSGGKIPAQSIALDVSNGANQVINSGTLNLNGINTIGLNVQAGSQATHSGKIVVTQGVDSLTKTANYGIRVQGEDAVASITSGGEVDLSGDGAIAVYAKDGGKVAIDGGNINFISGQNQLGYLIYGVGSSVSSQNSIQDVSTTNSTLYRIDGGAKYSSNGADLTGSGQNSTLLLSTGNGSDINTSGMTLTASGTGATAVKVEGGGHATIDASTLINLTGTGSVAGSVQGASTTIYGDDSAAGDSVLDSSAVLTSMGSVAPGAMGYKVASGGTLNNDGSLDVNGIAVDIIGANSAVNNTGLVAATDGIAAYRLSNGASLALSGAGATKAAGTANGILLDTGAAGLTVKDTIITMDAMGTGNGIENKAEIAGIQLTNTTLNVGNGAGVRTSATLAQTNSGTLNVNGSGTGLLFQNADGSMTNKAYDMSGSQDLVINVNSADGKGMTTNTSGDIKFGVSINVRDSAGGSALVIGGQTASVEQSGHIHSASSVKMVDINNGYTGKFTNSGTIASDSANAVVMAVYQQAVAFTNAAGGVLAGAVKLLNGNNSVTLAHGSQADSVFTTGTGDDTFNLTDITASENEALFNTLDGGGGHNSLNLDNSVYTLSDASKIQNMSGVKLTNNSSFTLDKTQLDLTATDADWNIDSSSMLAINDSADMDFASHLKGNGLVKIDLSSAENTFSFSDNNKADGFAGTVELTHSHFVLDDDTTVNNQALADATLKLGEGSVTDIAKGTQQIGSLAFNGGTAVFDTDTLGKSVSEAYVTTTGNLDISGSGSIQLTSDNPVFNGPVMPDNTVNILAQDDGDISMKLADSTGTVSNYGGNLQLLDRNGKAISDSVSTTIEQNGKTVANGTYDYRLTSGESNDGLYVNYGLTKVELLTGEDDALALNAEGATGATADLSAQVTGAGDLAIDTGTGNTVSLSNLSNNYTGKTDVRTGKLLANNNNVLGNTSELHQATGTTVDLNGYSQTVGMLNTDIGATTDFNGGSLALTNGGTVNGSLTGAGALAVNGGNLTVNGANSGMSAVTNIASGATVNLNDITGLGTSAITDDGLLALNEGVQGELATSITGSGNVDKNGSGLVTLTADAAQYSGTTNVNAGGLQLGSNGNDVILASSSVNVAAGSVFGGYGGTAGDVNNNGTLTLGGLSPQLKALRANATEGQTFVVGNNLSNSGVINISSPGASNAGNTLHVVGNYAGHNGTLNLNTVLGGDDSVTDKLMVDGDTSGTTQVAVTNAGGSGAKTLDGIEVVSVGGSSDGKFTKKGRIVAGAYDYDLEKKGSNWYLTNNSATPVPPVPDDGGDTPDNGGNTPDNGGNDDHHDVPQVRPEGKAYADTLLAANTMFNMTLHDRLGETHYVDALTGQENVTSLWLRQVGGHSGSYDGSSQNKTEANRYVAQLGGDIAQWSSNKDNRFHIGVMGGYANQHGNTRNHVNGYSADSSVSGYSAGLYGTWFQDDAEKTGAYVDSWMLYNWFDNTVSSKGATSESYKSKGLTASIETGYTWKMGEKNDHESYFVQPQAQVTWMGVKAHDHQESNGTTVQFGGDDNVQTRLGARLFIKGHNAKLDDGKNRTFEPFVEANWIHNTKDFSAGLNGVAVKVAGTRDIGQLKAGVEGKLNNNVNLWGNVAQEMGGKGYSDTQAMIGLKVNF
ncbi:autotransporter outer membrane beta-barrel domain-containing protein [Scandinavium sp. NPDC088450]|uniref:autotransporter outer membrane beta-barrel domain-containing protein n=1 Tax=Scandinavium sp. NPDC088450 TaxID=3364514 RepID=UPI00384CF5F9